MLEKYSSNPIRESGMRDSGSFQVLETIHALAVAQKGAAEGKRGSVTGYSFMHAFLSPS